MIRIQNVMVLAAAIAGGCVAPNKSAQRAEISSPQSVAQVQRLPPVGGEVRLASHEQSAGGNATPHVALAATEMQAGALLEAVTPESKDDLSAAGELDVNLVVAEVVARNPSVQAMTAAWEAASERYPQVVALEDPMLDVSVGPGSWGNSDVESAYMVMASQKFPWPGKRRLRGAVAAAEADGAGSQVEDVRLRLAEMARLAFYDYFAAYRNLALNADNLKETRGFRETAEAKLRAGLVTQQDVFQADVELALLERRRNELERHIGVATARINTLLHRDATDSLPPPKDLDASVPTPALDELRALAIQRRPDLAAEAAQIQADEATVALAWKEFYPDVAVYAKYDAFWQEEPLRTAVGVNLNVPLNQSRRYAAVREAELRLRQRRAEYERLVDEVFNDIHAGHERLSESQRTLTLYSDRIIPAAKQNVESARAGYAAGKVDFLRLIEAQRQLIALREQQVETVSNYHRNLAELDRAAAVPIEVAEPFAR